jgi:phosphoglycolate phosphatase
MTKTNSSSPYKAVLFDKDGTLFDFNATWAVFCDRMFDQLAGKDEQKKDALANACGYDRASRTFITGSLIVNSSADEVNEAWANLLPKHSLDEIIQLNHRVYNDLPVIPTCNLQETMARLRALNLKLGVATNDYEAGAISQLREARAEPLFDFICGSDSGYGRKPEAGMIHGFCDLMDIEPGEIIFVGDSTHDMDCGTNADVGLRVAVLTGPATREQLIDAADVILPSIQHLPAYLATTAS